ncbi:MAG: stalk domain-containing protein [Armatimonadota bacterium]
MKLRVNTRYAPVLAVALGLAAAGAAEAQRDRMVIPANTIVRATLQNQLDSRNAREGDRVTAELAAEDRSGFPLGTRFQGRVTEVERSSRDRPGVIDMTFDRALLPGGESVAINGDLASLAQDDIRRTRDGRIRARRDRDDDGGGGGRSFDWKWVGYGAAGGAVLGEIFGDNLLKGALLGGLGGAIYGYLNRDKDRQEFSEVRLDRGTEFGIRLSDRIAFNTEPGYRYTARNDRGAINDRVLGARQESSYAATNIMMDGRRVDLGTARPLSINGALYVPLAPVARAANVRLDHRAGDQDFMLQTRGGQVEVFTGETSLSGANGRDLRLDSPAMTVDGEIYVPVEFLTRVMDLRANWNPRTQRLDLESYR